MPDWIIWAAAGWMFLVITRPARRARLRRLRRRHRRRLERMRGRGRPELSPGPAREMVDVPTPAPRPPTTAEIEARLRQQYVAGKISVERYEAELDRLYTKNPTKNP